MEALRVSYALCGQRYTLQQSTMLSSKLPHDLTEMRIPVAPNRAEGGCGESIVGARAVRRKSWLLRIFVYNASLLQLVQYLTSYSFSCIFSIGFPVPLFDKPKHVVNFE